MQNEPNFRSFQPKNLDSEPKTNPNEPNFYLAYFNIKGFEKSVPTITGQKAGTVQTTE